MKDGHMNGRRYELMSLIEKCGLCEVQGKNNLTNVLWKGMFIFHVYTCLECLNVQSNSLFVCKQSMIGGSQINWEQNSKSINIIINYYRI